MTKCDEIVIDMDIASTKKTNTIAANAISTASRNCHSKKVRDCYILYTVLLVKVILLIAVNTCRYLIKYRTKHLLPFYK